LTTINSKSDSDILRRANSNEYIAARLSEMGYSRPVIIPSGAEARRRMTESDFELIVVNSPLPDEFGHEVCINAVEKNRCRRCVSGQSRTG
jgi:response regulator NasT